MEQIDMGIVQTISIISNVLGLVFFLLTSRGLYMINSKLGEKHAWLSWIPLLQIISYFSAAKKSSFYYFWLPVILLIVASVGVMFTFGISLLVFYIYLFVVIAKFFHAISLRTGRGAWTTVGFIFVPFIMFPIVGYKLEEKVGNNINTENKKEEVIIEQEEKIEL